MKMRSRCLELWVVVGLAAVSNVENSYAYSGEEKTAVLEHYLKIQEALANDSLKSVEDSAKAIEKNAENVEIKSAAKKLAGDKTLKTARKHFKELSVPMDRWAKEKKPAGVDRVSCSMAKASWLQRQGTVKNPYYGKEMSGWWSYP